MDEEFLGDGLYVSFDGYQYCLRAPREDGDHVVYIDPFIMANLDAYRERVAKEYDK